MELLKILGIGLVTAFGALLLKQTKPEMAVLISVTGGILMLSLAINMFSEVLTFFNQFADKTGVSSSLFKTVLKIVGIGYLTEFSATVCTEAGSPGIADKILFGGKITIMIVALPILTSLVDVIAGLLP